MNEDEDDSVEEVLEDKAGEAPPRDRRLQTSGLKVIKEEDLKQQQQQQPGQEPGSGVHKPRGVSWTQIVDMNNSNNNNNNNTIDSKMAAARIQPQPHAAALQRWPMPGSGASLPHPPVMQQLGRGHELMRRLCALNPQFASSVLEDYIRPTVRDDDVVLEIECGTNAALLYLSRLCQGSKGPCIWFQESWLTPNEFQYISGRETAKDWKRSIRHCGKSMKLLLTKGILTTHPPICDCDGCRISSPVVSEHKKKRCKLTSCKISFLC